MAMAVPAIGQPNLPPGVIAHRCVNQINHIAGVTVHQIHHAASRTVQDIQELLEAGDAEGAAARAEEGTNRINTLAANRTDHINQRAGHCVERLTELEAPQQMIDAVQNAAAARAELIEARRATAVQHIADALAG